MYWILNWRKFPHSSNLPHDVRIHFSATFFLSFFVKDFPSPVVPFTFMQKQQESTAINHKKGNMVFLSERHQSFFNRHESIRMRPNGIYAMTNNKNIRGSSRTQNSKKMYNIFFILLCICISFSLYISNLNLWQILKNIKVHTSILLYQSSYINMNCTKYEWTYRIPLWCYSSIKIRNIHLSWVNLVPCMRNEIQFTVTLHRRKYKRILWSR